VRFVLAEGDPERLDRALSRLLPDASRSTLKRWIEEGRVSVDGKPARASARVRSGAVLEVDPGSRLPSEAEPDASVALDVLYEDEELVVVNKPAGLVVHPARGHWTGTLVNGLLARPGFERIASDPRDTFGALRPGIVQRLDKDTSGVLVVAKTEAAREALKAQLAAHDTERRYLALTLGVPRSGRIEAFHGRDPRSRLKFTSRLPEGKVAITNVALRESLAGGRAALVECRLETGRTHQIRVHLAEQAKTPILADPLYATLPRDPELRAVAEALGRHALHAELLGFKHPKSGDVLRFLAPLPPDFEAALTSLRAVGEGARR
jgi:23S rRNA pseudouridine1911/1915/1917 synthase